MNHKYLSASLLCLALAGCSAQPIFEFESAPIQETKLSSNDAVMYGLPVSATPISVRRSMNKTTGDLTLEMVVKDPIYFADPIRRYALRPKRGAKFSSDVGLEVTEASLLKSVSINTKDAAPLAIQSIAETLSGIAKKGAIAAFDGSAVESVRKDLVFTPSNRAWSKKNPRHYLELMPESSQLSLSIEMLNGVASQPTDEDYKVCQASKLCFRNLVPYLLTFKHKPHVAKDLFLDDEGPVLQKVLLLPDYGPVGAVEPQRRALVVNEYTYGFSNGILVKTDEKYPGQVLAAVNLPLDVLKALVSIPSALFQFKVGSDTESLELDHEKSLIESRVDLLDAQEKLREAQEKNK